MATSSITANFTITDPKAARAFARALCAERSWAVPTVKVDYRHVTDPHEIDSFFRNSPYAKRRARKVSAREMRSFARRFSAFHASAMPRLMLFSRRVRLFLLG